MEDHDCYQPLILKQASWIPELVDLQINIIADSLISLFCRPPKPTWVVAVPGTKTNPSFVGGRHAAASIIKRVGYGFVGAAYIGAVLTVAMVVASVVGVGLVMMWVEEPAYVSEKLHLDYTEFNPEAVVWFSRDQRSEKMALPVGHSISVSVVLLMPESDFNREIGIFQLAAEALTSKGDVIAKSWQPCMLLFRSSPIRLARTYLMSVPILLGIRQETQRLNVKVLEYMEGVRSQTIRTEAIRIILMPRAGTHHLPQLYEAEIVVRSQLPWMKELVRRWKLTLSVWTSVYIFIMFVIVLLYRFTSLVFPLTTETGTTSTAVLEEMKEPAVAAAAAEEDHEQERELSDTLRRWHQCRKKRKAALLSRSTFMEAISSQGSSSSSTITGDYTGDFTVEEEVGS